MFLKLQFVKKKFFLKDSFKISRENKKFIKTIIIKLTENDKAGFAECVPYKRYGETQEKIFNEFREKWNELITITNIFKIANICDNYQICPLCRKWGCILDTTNADTINGNGIINNDTKLSIRDLKNCNPYHRTLFKWFARLSKTVN